MLNWRIALRTLSRRSGYAITAILILTLGIGAATTIFSVVDTILLKPLPYPDSDRLVTVYEANPAKDKRESLIAPARLEDWNRLNQTFSAISAQYTENVTDTSGTQPERLAGRRVVPRFFEVYGTRPLIGRTFNAQEELARGPLAAVIGYGLWTRRYGQNPAALGKRLAIGGVGCTIVGVMPKDFAPPSVDIWLPAQLAPYAQQQQQRDARFLSGVGRMKPGVAIRQAQADLARVQRALGEQYPRTDKDWSALVGDLKETRVGNYRRTLLLLFGAVGLLLLIAVANIAGLTLAQFQQREREMAIRGSLGASRAQAIAMAMREILLIAIAGAAAGGALAFWSTRLLRAAFGDIPRMAELRFDWRALAFAAAASFLGALIFGAAPALQAARGSLAAVLAESSRSVSGRRRSLQSAVVIAQLAVTLVLLSSAGLLLRSYYTLSHVDAGFDPAHTITFHVGAAWNEDRPRIGRMQLDFLSALERIPGVEAAGMTNFLPATGATLNFQFQLEGTAGEDPTTLMTGYRSVTAGYMQALKIPLLAGEWCPSVGVIDFNSKVPTKAMVNRRFVDLYAKGQSVIGRHFDFRLNPSAPASEISGVVGDVREDGLGASAAPYIYNCVPAGAWPDPEYVVRTRGDASALARQIPAVIHGIEPNRAVFGMKSLDSVLGDALEQPRLNTRFLAGFAGAAMLLASVGLYSLMTLIVTARTREIGVRIALGAQRIEVVELVLRAAAKMVIGGIAAGVLLSAAAQQFIQTALYGVSPLDAITGGSAILLLLAVSVIAAFLPARRAASIDPLQAIRNE